MANRIIGVPTTQQQAAERWIRWFVFALNLDVSGALTLAPSLPNTYLLDAFANTYQACVGSSATKVTLRRQHPTELAVSLWAPNAGDHLNSINVDKGVLTPKVPTGELGWEYEAVVTVTGAANTTPALTHLALCLLRTAY